MIPKYKYTSKDIVTISGIRILWTKCSKCGRKFKHGEDVVTQGLEQPSLSKEPLDYGFLCQKCARKHGWLLKDFVESARPRSVYIKEREF